MKVTFKGWPWQRVHSYWASGYDGTVGQKWGWNPFKVKGMGRFGGGWAIKIGVTVSKSLRDIVIDCGIGSIRIKAGGQG